MSVIVKQIPINNWTSLIPAGSDEPSGFYLYVIRLDKEVISVHKEDGPAESAISHTRGHILRWLLNDKVYI